MPRINGVYVLPEGVLAAPANRLRKAFSDIAEELNAVRLEAGDLEGVDSFNGVPIGSFYNRGNILGVVAHSGGDPTAAIIESGSNANGSYVRFANGLQECWQALDMGPRTAFGSGTYADPYRTDSQGWTFPAAFAAPPIASLTALVNVGGGAGRGIVAHARAVTATGVTLIHGTAINSNASAANVTIDACAIGGWF